MVRNLKLIIKADFDAAHYLQNYKGECANIHGHTWIVEAIFKVNPDNDYLDNITIDFKELKNTLNQILPDHKYLNELYDFNPTAENLSKYIFDELVKRGKKPRQITVGNLKHQELYIHES